MHQAILTVDLGFGDAGKGSIVDFLTRETAAHTVVRYNGGAQAGHRVVTDGPGAQEHVFAQFGSGTLAGAATHLSRFMLVDPLAMLAEAAHLHEPGHRRVRPHDDRSRRAHHHALPARGQPAQGTGARRCTPRQLRHGHRRDRGRRAGAGRTHAASRRPGPAGRAGRQAAPAARRSTAPRSTPSATHCPTTLRSRRSWRS